ncbi:CDP-diacylglycerol--glycerol-3-phosphate 3-phosphatidyltransferase [Rhodospirillaceae bacterium KN72]|uniref:CDP-diacylglycerol--glycerol-3-phosphate 3-phosphatidyltransferase n=1 Tax=Pacificispira spongiicola TaxID=2729598 RepID=A0A7Y0HHR1_9PROT|nr:CDP-diacylglycerol--glycerol-3-phosphate 3-phosphatidyltransferase [Pacificispira spongiicola]NMM45744.1 CDP-diacylglycerol--glycerol-3-phosphate 3-phosphatidyltransferase [Pacificispira spongiicola]
MLFSLPNILTLLRIVAIAPIVVLFYVDGNWTNWTVFGLFAIAGITDFFDGYLARATGQVSKLGRFLDPIADKLLVSAVILMLVAVGDLRGYAVLPGLVILIREITVSGLREYLAEVRVGVPVSSLAKWKTTIQMLALGFLIVGEASPAMIPSTLIGEVLIWIAAFLTVITGFDYLRAGLKHMTD